MRLSSLCLTLEFLLRNVRLLNILDVHLREARWVQVGPAVGICDELEALTLEFSGQIKGEHIVERHVMSITAEDNHLSVINDSSVSITRVGPDAAHPHLTLLTVGHVEAESVMVHLAEAKVVLFALQLINVIEAGVGMGDQQAPLHVSRCWRIKSNLILWLLALLVRELDVVWKRTLLELCALESILVLHLAVSFW